MKINQTYRDILLISFLLIISYIAVYIMPVIIRPLLLGGIVFAFIRSKDNVPWVVFFFFWMSAPANLFYFNDSYFLLLTPTVGIPYSILISIAVFVKAKKDRRTIRNYFSIEKRLYFFYLLILFIVGLFYGGLSFKSWFILMKMLPNLLILMFLPSIINMNKESDRIIKLLYVFTILLFIIQIFEVIFNRPLFNESSYFLYSKDGGLQRNITGTYFVFFTMILATSEFLSKRSKVTPLAIIASISSILILINTGTRGWMIASFFFVISLLIFGSKSKLFKMGIFTLGIFITISFFISEKYYGKYFDNINSSFDRFSTVFLLLEGDLSAGGTLSRLNDRGPRVMAQFEKNPFFGVGFSDRMFEFYDGHVANQSILFQSGIIGLLILYSLVYSILWKFLRRYLLLREGVLKFKVLSLIIGAFGLIIVHFSSQQMFAYMLRGDKIMLYAFWFLFITYYFDKAIAYGKK